jgi:hypothetical protein
MVSDKGHFNGISACRFQFELAHTLVDDLRENRANYFNNLGVRKNDIQPATQKLMPFISAS